MRLNLIYVELFILVSSCSIFSSLAVDINGRNIQEMNQEMEKHKRSTVHVTSSKFKRWISNSNRNYSVVAMFTALGEQYQCDICAEADDEFSIVAASYRKKHGPYLYSLFFVVIDAEVAPETFQKHQIDSAQYLYLPVVGEKSLLKMNPENLNALDVASWVSKASGQSIHLSRPINYVTWLVQASVVILLILFVVVYHRYIQPFSMLWFYQALKFSVVLYVTIMLGAFMWNQMNSPPNKGRGGVGINMFIQPQSRSQYVYESYIISGMYFLMTCSLIIGTSASNSSVFCRQPPLYIRNIIAVAGIGIFLATFNYLNSIFTLKSGSYPYYSFKI